MALASLPLLLLCFGGPPRDKPPAPRDKPPAAAAWRLLRAALASLLWVMSHARTPLTSRLSEETMPRPGTSCRAMAWSATSTARPQPGSRRLHTLPWGIRSWSKGDLRNLHAALGTVCRRRPKPPLVGNRTS